MLKNKLSNVNFQDTFESLFLKTYPLVHQNTVQNEKKTEKKVPEFQCNVCDEKFSKVKQFHVHLRAHSDVKLLICSICPTETFLKKSLLTQHRKVVHKNIYSKRFVCSVPQCKKVFYSPSLLQHHERYHDMERSHKCEICGIGFFKKSYLKEHLIVHGDVTSHSCKTCGKDFKELASLQSHELTHSVAKIFKCDQCTDTFNQDQLLNIHREEMHSNTIICIQNDIQLEPISSYDVSASSFIQNVQQIQQLDFTTDQTADTVPYVKPYPYVNSPALIYNGTSTINFNLKPNHVATEQEVIETLYSSLRNCSQMEYIETSVDKPKAQFDECRLFDDDEIAIETEKIIEELDITIEENGPNKDAHGDVVQNYNQLYTAHEAGISIINNNGKNDSDVPTTPYNLVNFELLATLTENHIDNNEYFNVDDLNPSTFPTANALTDETEEKSGPAVQIENAATNSIFFDQDLMSFLESTDIIEESVQALPPPVAVAEQSQIATTGSLYKNAVKKPVKKQAAFKAISKASKASKSLLIGNNNHTEQSNNNKNNFNNILNIKSVVTSNEAIENVEMSKPICDIQKVPPDNNTISEDLLKLVQKNKVQLYSTNDKDTFIISINSNMEAERIEKLIKDGLLTIDINEEEEQPNKDIDNQMISPEFLDTATCDTIFKNVDRLFEDTISLAGDDCGSGTSQDYNFNNLIHVNDMLVKSKDSLEEIVADAVTDVFQSMEPLKDINSAGIDQIRVEAKKKSVVKGTQKKTLRKVYACKLCNKIFNKKDNYQSHMGSHEGSSQRHKCDECDQKFSWRSTLTRHKSAKHGPRTVCPYCSASYTTLSQAHQHIHEIHLQKKKFKCDFPDCGQAFFKSTYLKIHYRTHTKERPYRCRLCGVTFNFSSHRLRHERTHYTPPPLHGQRIVRCSQMNFGNNNILPTQWNIKSH